MNPANLSATAVIGGLAALTATLFVLQRLRVRQREIVVPTTLFWRAAAEPAAARSLFQRFQQPWAFALLLLISSLLWLAVADPRPAPRDTLTLHVAVLDGSAAMASGPRFDAARDALIAQVRALPADRRQVLWCGAEVRTLLNPGEHESLLAHRLADRQPEAAPSHVAHLLASLARSASAAQPVDVTLFSDLPVGGSVSSNTAFHLTRIAPPVHNATSNHGIVAMGLAETSSGAWTEVDAYAETASNDPTAPIPAVRFELDGAPLDPRRIRSAPAAQGTGYVITGLPATGGLLTAHLPSGDALSLDNIAQVRLPNRTRLRVHLSSSLAALRPALAADPAVELVNENAQIAIRRAGESVGAGLPTLEFVPRAAQPAFRLVHPARLDSATVLREASTAIGLGEIDAVALATAAAAPITVDVAPGQTWRIEVWEDLLAPDYTFTASRAFPLFLANAVRWLAQAPGLAPVTAAGRPWVRYAPDNAARALTASGAPLEPLGDRYTPPNAGPFTLEGEPSPRFASLLDRATTTAQPVPTEEPVAAGSPGFRFSPTSGLLLAALLLLLAEWHLHQRGRVP